MPTQGQADLPAGNNKITEEQAKALRAPFPREVIGKLPKAGIMLDYVGHAATTDRLLQVDPAWTWEPMGYDEQGLPACDKQGNLWIRLTVCGVTRIGVGDGPTMKERIGDAIRNAAMRFGVALDLWAKEDLDAMHREPAKTADPAWVKDITTRIGSAASGEELADLGKEVAAKTNAGEVSDEDRNRLASAYQDAKARIAEEAGA